jgi:ABC-type bacteriocin/lantibiotic exporter with double-glycine peptidase domain
LPRLRKESRSLALVVALAMIAGVGALAPPMLNQILIDQVLVGGASAGVLSLLAVTAVVFAVLASAQFLRAYLAAHVVARIDAALVSQLFGRLLALPLEYFMSRRNGDLQRRLRSIQQVRELVVNRGIDALLAIVQLAVALLVVGVYSPPMLAVYVLTTPLYAFAMWAALRAIRPTLRRVEEAHAKYESDQTDAIASILAVKSAGAEAFAHKHIVRSFARVARAEFGNAAVVASYQALVRILGFAASAAALWRSATLVQGGELTLGAFVALGTVSTMIGGPLLTLLGIWDEAQRGRVLLDRVADVLTHPTESESEPAGRTPTLRGRVTLAGVTYRYPGARADVLRGLDLDLVPGEKIAIVGESGSGKSTVGKLVAGLLRPTAGRVAFDEIDALDVPLPAIRQHVALVPQQSQLVPGTVLENITLSTEPDVRRAVAAAKIADAHGFVQALPDGYRTRIGDGQTGLSGGQLQRIALARAVYRAPSVLVLDEATSALDARGEEVVRKNLAEAFRSTTTLVITHRVSALSSVDRICVVDGGAVVELGSYEALMARRGLFFDLAQRMAG